ncbi:MAG: hypothetical protein J0I69_02995 [Altererythrobacter sp.]|nr:hypothetical protein [Altererythrobacter sp.]OJU61092.1 MAG: hypothetical protein BGO08_12700 [Altererythrobacter sp. 66-12]
MTPLERAARALCSLDGNPENATMEGKPLWQDYLPEARAVLEAIREPSDAMLEVDARRPDGSFYPEDHWRAMIDAALEEG